MQTQNIYYFKNNYRFLSNFFTCQILYKDYIFQSAEQLFQFRKTNDLTEKENIVNAKTPGEAKKLGKKVTLVKNWNQIKEYIMFDCVFQKFNQNIDLKNKLLKTNDYYLVEGNNWHDNYWGKCYCDQCVEINSQNKLGIILMKLRDIFQNKS